MRLYIKQNNTLKSVRAFSKSELIPPEPPFNPTPELVYTLSADGTYYIVGTGFTSIEDINADTSGGNTGSGLNSSWTGGEVNIPAMYNGKPVKAIAPKAFQDLKNITKFNIQDGQMTTIGHNVLQCRESTGGFDTTLTEVHLPNTLTELGGENGRVFWGRQATGFSVNLGDTQITSVRYYTFYMCNGLTSINIPDSITSIEDSAFRECRSLISITIPSSVTNIGQQAFYWCIRLRTFNFDGTRSQWNTITKGGDWNQNSEITVVHCTDGNVSV